MIRGPRREAARTYAAAGLFRHFCSVHGEGIRTHQLCFFVRVIHLITSSCSWAVYHHYQAPPGLACCLAEPYSPAANEVSLQHLHCALYRRQYRDRPFCSTHDTLHGYLGLAQFTAANTPYTRIRVQILSRQWNRMAQPNASNRQPRPQPTAP
nr:hypothetical protein [uncultured organism]